MVIKLNKFQKKIHFTGSLVLEAKGFAGRIWVLWDENFYSIEGISIDDQIINTVVQQKNKASWLLSAVYASPKPQYRKALWNYIGNFGQFVNIP